MASFEVTLYGQFWVTPEAAGSSLHGNAVHIELNRYSHVLADGFGGKGPVGQTGGHCPLN
jgi:hypothetical protein